MQMKSRIKMQIMPRPHSTTNLLISETPESNTSRIMKTSIEFDLHCFEFPVGLIDVKPASTRSFMQHGKNNRHKMHLAGVIFL